MTAILIRGIVLSSVISPLLLNFHPVQSVVQYSAVKFVSSMISVEMWSENEV